MTGLLRHRRHRRHATAGYSMIEVAIILAVIAFVLSALWIAAYNAWEYTRREQVREAIATTVANARSYFAGQTGVPAVSQTGVTLTSTAMTNLLLQVNVIPSTLERTAQCSGSYCADNPWGSFTGGAQDPAGTFQVCNWTLGSSTSCASAPAGTSAFFGIALSSLYRKSCMALVETMSSATEPTGLVDININGTNLVAGLSHPIQPVSDSDVISLCSAADGTDFVTFVYRVVAPSP